MIWIILLMALAALDVQAYYTLINMPSWWTKSNWKNVKIACFPLGSVYVCIKNNINIFKGE